MNLTRNYLTTHNYGLPFSYRTNTACLPASPHQELAYVHSYDVKRNQNYHNINSASDQSLPSSCFAQTVRARDCDDTIAPYFVRSLHRSVVCPLITQIGCSTINNFSTDFPTCLRFDEVGNASAHQHRACSVESV